MGRNREEWISQNCIEMVLFILSRHEHRLGKWMQESRVDIGVPSIGPTRLFIMRASRDRMVQTSDSISSIRDLWSVVF